MKKTAKVLAVTASMVALAGVAQAATYDINIYGASAQFNFLAKGAAAYLGTGTGTLGCTGLSSFVKDSSGKHGIITGTSCTPSPAITGFTAGSTVNIRVSNKASYDGIWAVKGLADVTITDSTNPDYICEHTAPLNGFQRRMITSTTDTSLSCQRVTAGASDVAGASFLQGSKGVQFGWKAFDATSNPVVDRSNIFIGTGGISTSDLPNHYSPVAVPFGFYAHNDVTYNGLPITNLTRLQAVSLFSGGIKKWSDFGAGYPDLHATICLRHAGSGSGATLDGSVMNGGLWGTALISTPNNPNDAAAGSIASYDNTVADVYFNDGTSDELNCVNTFSGAVGYADADAGLTKAASYANIPNNGAGDVLPIMYQGVAPSANAIANGVYDFWTKEQVFLTKNAPSTVEKNTVQHLTTYLNSPTVLAGVGFGGYWANLTSVLPTKTGDFTYPTR
jgi:hypothetical protein